MMYAIEMKKLMKEAASFVIHFAHGGLLVAGILVTTLLLAHVGTAESHERGLQEIGDLLAEGRAYVASSDATVSVASSAEVRAIVEYLSRKYRVAAAAVEPLVLAAQAAGERAKLDPALLVAVVAIESGFNPIAESPMGAQGLMQVIPRFHQDKLNALPGNNSLLDPVVNIHVGAQVLKESIRRAGSLEAGLQQYAGAVSDEEGVYAAKVLAEKQRIESAARRGRQTGA
jgi:soluble lytic murein transglycosylase-like protein